MHADPVASVSHEIKLVEVVYFALQAGGAATFGVEIKLKTCVFWPLQVFELPADLAVVYMRSLSSAVRSCSGQIDRQEVAAGVVHLCIQWVTPAEGISTRQDCPVSQEAVQQW